MTHQYTLQKRRQQQRKKEDLPLPKKLASNFMSTVMKKVTSMITIITKVRIITITISPRPKAPASPSLIRIIIIITFILRMERKKMRIWRKMHGVPWLPMEVESPKYSIVYPSSLSSF